MKVCLISLGCKVNQYESESIAKKLQENNVEVVFGLSQADVYVLNTCAVTNEAERKSRGYITKILKLNPNAKIYVCGCSSQNNPEKFTQKNNIIAVYGTAKKMDIADLILQSLATDKINNAVSECYEDNYVPLPSHTRSYIKIQDGCNNFCSYCLIPYLRGRSRSRSLESIKNEIEYHSKNSREVVLTGINLSAYGEDLDKKLTLLDVANLFKDFINLRFRFSSLEVNIINDTFLKGLIKLKNFCPHFHLSLQSGSDNVLKNMNRHYSSQDFLAKVALIRQYYPNAAITTDVIVGFPTEGEKEFNESYETCKKAMFAYMHIFPYSPRNGTNALKLKNIATNVPQRIKELSELRDAMQKEFINSQKGLCYNCLIEAKINNGGYYQGHTENFIKCYIKDDDKNIKSNVIYNVQIVKYFKDGAIAIIKN